MFGAALSAGAQSSGLRALDGRAEHWVRSGYTTDQGYLGRSTDQGQGLSGQRWAYYDRELRMPLDRVVRTGASPNPNCAV